MDSPRAHCSLLPLPGHQGLLSPFATCCHFLPPLVTVLLPPSAPAQHTRLFPQLLGSQRGAVSALLVALGQITQGHSEVFVAAGDRWRTWRCAECCTQIQLHFKGDITECKKNGLGGYWWTDWGPGRTSSHQTPGFAVLGSGVTHCLAALTVTRHRQPRDWQSGHFMSQCPRITSAGAGAMPGTPQDLRKKRKEKQSKRKMMQRLPPA